MENDVADVPTPTLPPASITNGVPSGFASSSTTNALPAPVWLILTASRLLLTLITTELEKLLIPVIKRLSEMTFAAVTFGEITFPETVPTVNSPATVAFAATYKESPVLLSN